MFTKISWIVATTLALLCICVNTQQQQSTDLQLVSRVCLGCMCEARTGCNTTIGCSGTVCGPFAITRDYWVSSGKPTLNNELLNDNSYEHCVNDLYCAAAAVQGYMARFGRDCTENGVIDCDDYLRIHRLGPHGCTINQLESEFENRYKLCMHIIQRLSYWLH